MTCPQGPKASRGRADPWSLPSVVQVPPRGWGLDSAHGPAQQKARTRRLQHAVKMAQLPGASPAPDAGRDQDGSSFQELLPGVGCSQVGEHAGCHWEPEKVRRQKDGVEL